MIYDEPLIKPSGDRALRVTFGDERSLRVNRPVRTMGRLMEADPNVVFTELVPTYASLTVMYDPSKTDSAGLTEKLARMARLAMDDAEAESVSRLLHIPVCYEGEYAPDMGYICDYCGLSPEEVIRLHTAEPYFVFQLGFTPGCPFIGPLQEALHVPLMQSPRTDTPQGAVAISVGQTVIYPRATPGGMRIVGRTPVQLFQLDHPDLTLFKPADRVLFHGVSKDDFGTLEKAARNLMDEVEVEGVE